MMTKKVIWCLFFFKVKVVSYTGMIMLRMMVLQAGLWSYLAGSNANLQTTNVHEKDKGKKCLLVTSLKHPREPTSSTDLIHPLCKLDLSPGS
jgi:hypothetical protein